MSSVVEIVDAAEKQNEFMFNTGREFSALGRKIREGARRAKPTRIKRVMQAGALRAGKGAEQAALQYAFSQFNEAEAKELVKSIPKDATPAEKRAILRKALIAKKTENIRNDLEGKGLLGVGGVIAGRVGAYGLRGTSGIYNSVGRFLLDKTALGQNRYGSAAIDWIGDKLKQGAARAKMTRTERAAEKAREQERLADMTPEERKAEQEQKELEKKAGRHRALGWAGGLAGSLIRKNLDTSTFGGRVIEGLLDKASDAHEARSRQYEGIGGPALSWEQPEKPKKISSGGKGGARALPAPNIELDNSKVEQGLDEVRETLDERLGQVIVEVKRVDISLKKALVGAGGITQAAVPQSTHKKDRQRAKQLARRADRERNADRKHRTNLENTRITKKDFKKAIRGIGEHLESQGRSLKRLGGPIKALKDKAVDKAKEKGGSLLADLLKMRMMGSALGKAGGIGGILSKAGGLLGRAGGALASGVGALGAAGSGALAGAGTAAAAAAPMVLGGLAAGGAGYYVGSKIYDANAERIGDATDFVSRVIRGKHDMEGGLKIAEKTTVDKGEFGRLKHSDGGDTIIAEAMRQSGMYEGKSLEELKSQAMKLDVEEYNKILEAGRQKRAERRAQARQSETAKRADGVQVNPAGQADSLSDNNVGLAALEAARARANAPGASYQLGAGHLGVDPRNETRTYNPDRLGTTGTASDRVHRGDSMQNAYDCSGLMAWAYRDVGVDFGKGNLAPRTADMETYYQKAGFTYYKRTITKRDLDVLRPGDVLLKDGHTEMYAGNGMLIGAHGAGQRQQIGEKPFSGTWKGFFRWERGSKEQKPKSEEELAQEGAQKSAESAKRMDGVQVSENESTPIAGGNQGSAPIQQGGTQAIAKKRKGRRGGMSHAEQFASNPRSQQAIDYFMSQGWTREQAIGIAANLGHESGYKTSAEGDKGYKGGSSFGIAQWREGRVENFKRIMGKHPTEASYEEQLQFVQWEMQNTHKKAGNEIRNATTAADAAAAMTVHYEIPKDRFNVGRKRGETAAQMEALMYGNQRAQATPSQSAERLSQAQSAQSAKAIMDNSSNAALSNAAVQRDKAKSQPIVVPMPQQNQPINVHAGRNMEGQTAGPMNMAPEPSIITRMIEAEYFAQM